MEPTFSTDITQQALQISQQIAHAIAQVIQWNDSVGSEDDYYQSSDGMQKLAASCMLIEAIGEGVNRIHKITEGKLLPLRPESPWQDVIGLRNHIAHGYFDIDAGIVLATVKNDLPTLAKAIQYFITLLDFRQPNNDNTHGKDAK